MMIRLIVLFVVGTFLFGCGVGDSDDIGLSEGSVSQGGSLARFTIVEDYLYVVNDFSLVPIDITDLTNPITRKEIDLGFGIETIFPYQGNLFIGSASAVYIFTINDPSQPTQRSVYVHSTGCDPVVVNGDFAYVTLRDGFSCGNPFQINVLEVVDVSDLDSPFRVNTVQMTNPRGLAVGCNNKLYVCEGEGGLVQFDITDPENPVQEIVYDDYAANDLIIRDDLVIVTGDDGIYQYSCGETSLELMSILPLAL